uniref:Immunoglobulin domain-containing protein n=1 Tax=Cyprinus carpio TaxID=7962 RepID=A0A8C2BUP8_CYPCA
MLLVYVLFGLSKLLISSSGVFVDYIRGVSVSVMEGDSVTLNTDVKTNQHDIIKWYFNNIRIAQISEDLSFICTDVQCNEGTERFRDRLKLDHQTGSLTIMNITNTDSGDYKLKIINSSSISEKTFNVTVYDVSAAERDEMKRKSVKEGESVTLDPGVMKNPNDLMTWYFNDICIAEISEEPRMICTDVQFNNGTERFRDRLKLDHQTGSLTIMNTTITDSGLYKLQINSSRFTIIRSFTVNVTVSGLSAGKKAGICAAAVLLLIAASVCGFYFYKRRVKRKGEYYISDGKSVFFFSVNWFFQTTCFKNSVQKVSQFTSRSFLCPSLGNLIPNLSKLVFSYRCTLKVLCNRCPPRLKSFVPIHFIILSAVHH